MGIILSNQADSITNENNAESSTSYSYTDQEINDNITTENNIEQANINENDNTVGPTATHTSHSVNNLINNPNNIIDLTSTTHNAPNQNNQEIFYIKIANNQTFPKYISSSPIYQECWDKSISSWWRKKLHSNKQSLIKPSEIYNLCGWQIVGLDLYNDKTITNPNEIIIFRYRILFYNELNPLTDKVIKDFIKEPFYCLDNKEKICIQKIVSTSTNEGLIGISKNTPYAVFDVQIKMLYETIIEYKMNKNHAELSTHLSSRYQLFEKTTINLENNNFLQNLATNIIQNDLQQAQEIGKIQRFPDKKIHQINCNPNSKDMYYGNSINNYCQEPIDNINTKLKFGDIIKTRIFFMHQPRFFYTSENENCQKILTNFIRNIQEWPDTYRYQIIYTKSYDYGIFYGKQSPCQIQDVIEIYTNHAVYAKLLSYSTLQTGNQKVQLTFLDKGLVVLNSTIYIKEPVKDIVKQEKFKFPFSLERIVNFKKSSQKQSSYHNYDPKNLAEMEALINAQYNNLNIQDSNQLIKEIIFLRMQSTYDMLTSIKARDNINQYPCGKLVLKNYDILHKSLFQENESGIINLLNNYGKSNEVSECIEYLSKNNTINIFAIEKITEDLNYINKYKNMLRIDTNENQSKSNSLFIGLSALLGIFILSIITVYCFFCKNKKQTTQINNNLNEQTQLLTVDNIENVQEKLSDTEMKR